MGSRPTARTIRGRPYGEELWKRLADDFTARHGHGFYKSNIALMRAFYLQSINKSLTLWPLRYDLHV